MIAMFTMYFGGGVIPTYLLYLKLGLINSFAVYIIPSLLSVYNMLLCMAFFRDIPESLVESAKLDGARRVQNPGPDYCASLHAHFGDHWPFCRCGSVE